MNLSWYNLTLPSPAHYLAYDEIQLDACENGMEEELLWFWLPEDYFVVLGYANRAASEVNVPFCEDNRIPILRRCTGGGTVLQGPGCRNYSVCLRTQRSGLHSISSTNDFIMQKHQLAFSQLLGVNITRQGHTDLTVNGLKFSGNAQ